MLDSGCGDDGLYARLAPHVSTAMRFIRWRYRTAQSWPDIEQDVWCRLLQSPGVSRCPTPAALTAYCVRTAERVVLNRFRSDSRLHRRFAPVHDAALANHAGAPLMAGSGRDAGRVHDSLVLAIGALPSPARRLIVLRFGGGFSAPRIAAATGCSTKAIERRLDRLLARLKRDLTSSGVTWLEIQHVLREGHSLDFGLLDRPAADDPRAPERERERERRRRRKEGIRHGTRTARRTRYAGAR